MNNDFDLPDLKENEENINNENNQNKIKEKIEIPQAYYDKLEKEKQERLELQKKKEEEEKVTQGSGGTFMLIFIHALFIFALLYSMIHFNRYIIFVIPAYILLGTIISCKNKGKDTSFNVSILVGGMLSAILCFVITMIKKEMIDTFTYYAFASFVVAFLGYTLSTIITKIMTDKENVKAMQTIFYLLIIAAMIGVPYYFYTTRKSDFMKYVFQVSGAEVADTEEGFILGTLKDRYKKDFNCEGKVKYLYDEVAHTRANERTCSTDNVSFTVISTIYNEEENQYIVKDGYLDKLYITKAKDELEANIKNISEAKSVEISLYPENKCYFIGDCESNENFNKEMDIENLYKYSKELKIDNYLNISKEEFINTYKFRILISIKGDYAVLSEEAKREIVNNTLDILTQAKYKNTSGYEIDLKDAKSYSIVYKATGKTNNDKTFTDPQVENIEND